MPRATFGKDRRLLKASEYKEVFDNNSVRVAHPKYLILAKPNGTSVSRLGLVVGKKNVPTAVGRNQVKRIVRETFRNSYYRLRWILSFWPAKTLTNSLLLK